MGMDELAGQFRRSAEGRSGLRYGKGLQEQALRYAELARAQGRSRREIAADLGINVWTLARWQEGREASSSTIHEVVVAESRQGAVLVMPSGVRVEGLSLSELKSVLAELG